jgi:hypothetical protein
MSVDEVIFQQNHVKDTTSLSQISNVKIPLKNKLNWLLFGI